MWIKTDKSSGKVSFLNLEKVQLISVYRDGIDCVVVACLDGDGYTYPENGGSPHNTVRLFEGTSKECQDYMGWLDNLLRVVEHTDEY